MMKVTEFAELVAEREAGKKEVSIAQIKEIVKITKDIIKEQSDIDMYAIIRKMDYWLKPTGGVGTLESVAIPPKSTKQAIVKVEKIKKGVPSVPEEVEETNEWNTTNDNVTSIYMKVDCEKHQIVDAPIKTFYEKIKSWVVKIFKWAKNPLIFA